MEISLPEWPYKEILDQLLEGCQIVDSDWRYRYLNDTAVRHVRKARPELLGKSMLEIFPGIANTPLFATLVRCQETQLPQRLDNRLVYPDGDTAWFELVIKPVSGGLLILSLDITAAKQRQEKLEVMEQVMAERRQAEEALKESEFNYRRIVETANEGIWAIDSSCHITYVNQIMADLLKYAPEEMLGRPVSGFVFPADQPHFQTTMEQLRQGKGDKYEVRLRCRDDSELWGIMSESALIDETGHYQGAFAMFTDITAQKETQEALRKSERRLSLAQGIAHIGNWEWEVDSGNTFWSDEVYRIFGLEPGASKPSYELAREHTHPDDLELWQQAVQAALDAKAWFSLDYRGQRADGSLVWIHNEAQVIRDAQGRACKMVGTAQDITARKQAEEALRQSEERLRMAQTAAGVGVWDWQPQKQVVSWTPEMEKLYGLLPHTIKSYQDWNRLVHPDDLPRIEAERDTAFAQNLPFNVEFRILRPSGEMRWLQSRGGAFYSNDGCLVRVSGIDIDVTERKLIEEALQQSQAWLQLALKYAQAGLWEWNLQDNTVFWSQEIWHLSGLDPQTHKPSYETWRQTVHSIDLPEVEHKLQGAAQKGEEVNLEWRTYLPDGVERWIMSRGQPCRDSNGQISSYLGISLDITERKQAEQDLRESRERLHFLACQLLTAQEQERKRLALELHDELGHALLILKYSLGDIAQKLPPKQKKLKHLIQEQVEHIKHVIQEVRRLYRNLSPGDVENLGLNRALNSLIEDFAGHLLHIAWQVDLPELTGCFSLPMETMIYRIVQEALTNIGKYAEPTQVNISGRKENRRLRLVIEDNGRGFDLSEVQSYPARGLGLAAMRERLYSVGGSLEILSQTGQGTRLTLTIPTLTDDSQQDRVKT
jgi:PAS domain S-box-containing protein